MCQKLARGSSGAPEVLPVGWKWAGGTSGAAETGLRYLWWADSRPETHLESCRQAEGTSGALEGAENTSSRPEAGR